MFKPSLIILLWSIGLLEAVSYGGRYNVPEHPGKCVIKDKVLTPGQSIQHPVMACGLFTCDDAQGLATVETCDPISALPTPLSMIKYDPNDTPTCKWGDFIDTTAPYPDCCKRHFSCVL